MKYFAGLDVSLEQTAICVVDESGRIVKEGRAASAPRALYEALRKIDLPLERIGLEACSLTAWLYDGIRAEGLPAICIETRQAKAAMKTMPNKTDRNDARALAQIMRTGWYRQVRARTDWRRYGHHGACRAASGDRGHDVARVRANDKAGPQYRPQGASLPATHEHSRCGTHHRARLPCHDRSAGPLSPIEGCRSASGSDPGTLSIWRDGHSGQGKPMR